MKVSIVAALVVGLVSLSATSAQQLQPCPSYPDAIPFKIATGALAIADAYDESSKIMLAINNPDLRASLIDLLNTITKSLEEITNLSRESDNRVTQAFIDLTQQQDFDPAHLQNVSQCGAVDQAEFVGLFDTVLTYHGRVRAYVFDNCQCVTDEPIIVCENSAVQDALDEIVKTKIDLNQVRLDAAAASANTKACIEDVQESVDDDSN